MGVAEKKRLMEVRRLGRYSVGGRWRTLYSARIEGTGTDIIYYNTRAGREQVKYQDWRYLKKK